MEFDQFVTANADGLHRTAYLITWDLHTAEDLVQETFIKVAKRWPKVRRMDHPVAYARRILVNEALSEGPRRARDRARAELSVIESLPEHSAPTEPRADDDLLDALKQLPPRQRAALVLRYFLDLPETEVAAAMGVSLGTVKSTTSRGLARLEQTLNHHPRSMAS
jgi:RNA polymerase sigma-70 factor (sigma-E family)